MNLVNRSTKWIKAVGKNRYGIGTEMPVRDSARRSRSAFSENDGSLPRNVGGYDVSAPVAPTCAPVYRSGLSRGVPIEGSLRGSGRLPTGTARCGAGQQAATDAD